MDTHKDHPQASPVQGSPDVISCNPRVALQEESPSNLQTRKQSVEKSEVSPETCWWALHASPAMGDPGISPLGYQDSFN